MHKRAAILGLSLALMLAVPASARAETDVAFYASATFDVLILRPLGVAASVVGAGLFVPAAIVTAPNGLDSIQETWRLFVVTPAEHVYTRPIGDW